MNRLMGMRRLNGIKAASLSLAAFAVAAAGLTQGADAATREYWVQAEEILWDYAPSYPMNRMMGMPFGPAAYVGEYSVVTVELMAATPRFITSL